MKRTILLTAAILCAAGTRAQEAYDLLIPEPETPVALRPVEGGRIYRTEVIPYDKRHDADARNLAGADAYMAYTPNRSPHRATRLPSGRWSKYPTCGRTGSSTCIWKT